MKKLVVLSMGLAAIASANAADNTPSQPVNQPVAVVRIFDTTGGNAKLMSGNELSRRKPRNACVIVANVPVLEKNSFIQYFQAPAQTKMDIPATIAQVKGEANGKNYLVSKTVTKAEMPRGETGFCWGFTEQDPVGEYTIDVQFNNIVFKNLKFKVLK